MVEELIYIIKRQIEKFSYLTVTDEEKVNASIIIKNLSEAIKNLER